MFRNSFHPDALRRPTLRWLLGLLLVFLIIALLMNIRQYARQAQTGMVSQVPVAGESDNSTDSSEQIRKQLDVLEQSKDEPALDEGGIAAQLETLVTASPDTPSPIQEETRVQLDVSSQSKEQ